MQYIVCSDIHLGHPNTPTEHIVESFKSSILIPENSHVDVLFISGDLFDRLLELNSTETYHILGFFGYLLDYCYANNIKLRVLEGTPSHDWWQSQTLVKMNDIRTHRVDLKYFKALDIEHIPELDKHILYIPDEWSNSHKEIEKQIASKLEEKGIAQVDLAILHGQFTYQVAGRPCHGLCFDESYFLNLVKGYIHVGHYHTYTSYDRVIANGSLERLAHGEEEDKGYVVVDGTKYRFVSNKNAYTYKTIQVTSKTTLEDLDKKISKLPKNSHIRIKMNKDHPYNLSFQNLRTRYLDYKLKKLVKDSDTEDSKVTYITDEDLEAGETFIIDGNIVQMLGEVISNKNALNDKQVSKLNTYLEVFKDAVTTD